MTRPERKRGRGFVSFRFSLSPDYMRNIESILTSDLNGQGFISHEPRIPLHEMADTYYESYTYMAEEFGKKVPGIDRGLKDGDWIIASAVDPETGQHVTMRVLVAPWRYKKLMEPYCTGLSWDPSCNSAMYLLQPQYPNKNAK